MAKKAEKTQVEILEGNVAKIDIKIPAKEAQEAYDKAYRRVASSINIPGFRKGKAPKGVVEKYVSSERIKTEAIEQMFPKHFSKVVEENDLELAVQPYIESWEFETGKDVELVVKAELKPEVVLGDYKGVEAQYEEFVPEPDAVEKELKALQERFSTLVNVEGRSATATDTLVFDFEGFANGKPIEHGAAQGYTMDLAHSSFIPGFAEGLVGHSVGEEFTINVTFPKEYHADELKGAAAEFKIKIHEIKEKVLPELNDELAKRSGKFETLEALKADIETFVKESAEKENENRKTNAAFLKAVDNAKIDVQKTMLDREVNAMKEETKQRLASQGFTWEQMVAQEGGEAAINEKLAFEALERVKNTLVIEKIAKVENIQISQQDIMDEINDIARSYGTQGMQILEQIKESPSSFSLITQQSAMKKVRKLIMENAKFTTADKTKKK